MLLNDIQIPDTATTTFDKCPNKCGGLLVEWHETNYGDLVKVFYCANCEERFEE